LLTEEMSGVKFDASKHETIIRLLSLIPTELLPTWLTDPETGMFLQRLIVQLRSSSMREVMEGAKHMVHTHPTHVESIFSCMALNSTGIVPCDSVPLIHELANVAKIDGSGTRPIAYTKYLGPSILEAGIARIPIGNWTIALRCIFWIVASLIALNKILSEDEGLLTALPAVTSPTAEHLLQAHSDKSREARWMVITSVFPNFESYAKTLSKDGPSRDQEMADLCGYKNVKVKGEEASSDVCWRHMKTTAGVNLGRNLENASLIFKPQNLLISVIFLLILSTQTMATTCPKTPSDFPRTCTNSNDIGSICVSQCATLTRKTSEKAVYFNPHSTPLLTFCGTDGGWGGFDTCIQQPMADCFSDGITNVRLLSVPFSGSFATFPDAARVCDTLDCDAITQETDRSFRLYSRTNNLNPVTIAQGVPPNTLAYSLGVKTWFKGACGANYRRFRTMHPM